MSCATADLALDRELWRRTVPILPKAEIRGFSTAALLLLGVAGLDRLAGASSDDLRVRTLIAGGIGTPS
ncbi:hypothetical protein HYQ46_010545 [Verticillium longisporum]|nr:hypothetical protein HYQ46_010545 [Verticillium longisporum]